MFRPDNEINKGFYAEKPIQINVTGTYDELANFASGIAALPRIVTLHSIKIEPKNKSDKTNVRGKAQQLAMAVVAKTYRYLEDDETE